jgi:hypothetical protein
MSSRRMRTFLTSDGVQPPLPTTTKKLSGTTTNTTTTTTTTGTTGKESKSGLVLDAENNDNEHNSNLPRTLLTLVRSFDKRRKKDDTDTSNEDDFEEYEKRIEQIVDLLNHLIAVYSRRGLLQGCVTKAERILSSSSTTPMALDGSKNYSRTKKAKMISKSRGTINPANTDLSIQNDSNEAMRGDSSTPSNLPDEALVFTAILRIFPTSNTNIDATNTTLLPEDRLLLINLVSELCVAITQHIRLANNNSNNNKSSAICSFGEFELLAQHGKSILSGMVNAMQYIQVDASTSTTSTSTMTNGSFHSTSVTSTRFLTLLPDWDDDIHAPPLISILKASCIMVSLFGTKLSRSTVLVQDLRSMSMRLLTISNDSVQEAAARLVACLPLAGGIDGITPSHLWNIQLTSALTALSTVLRTMAPLTKSIANSIQQQQQPVTTSNGNNGVPLTIDQLLEDWIHFVRRNLSDQTLRLRCFYRLTRGLVKVIGALMLPAGFGQQSGTSSRLVGAQVDVQALLDTVELFVSFPITAESVYLKTKSRLRDEVVEGGLLSLKLVAMDVSNHIKQLGLELLDNCLSSMGGSLLLPVARRIARIGYASILTSCSGPVRAVMDPTNGAQLERRNRRWLHLSVPMRAASIRTFTRVLCMFGYDSTGVAFSNFGPTSSSAPTSDCDRAISLVVGCLIEQIGHHNKSMNDDEDKFDDDWGSKVERVDMIDACVKCLSMTLTSCSGFLCSSIRRLIESVALSALLMLCDFERRSSSVMAWAPIKIGILHLASSCITAPWNDGSSSSLSDRLVDTAKLLECDMDLSVCHAAKEALRICDALQIPRAPALLLVSHRAAVESGAGHLDASSITEGIERIREDTARAKKKEVQDEKLKVNSVELKRKDNRQETSKASKAVPKRQKVHLDDENVEVSLPLTNPLVQQSTVSNQQTDVHSNDMATNPTSQTSTLEFEPIESSHNDDLQMGQDGGISTIPAQAENDDKANKEINVVEGTMDVGEEDGGMNLDEDDDLPEIFAGGGPDSDEE